MYRKMLENSGFFLVPSDGNWTIRWGMQVTKNMLVTFHPTIQVDGNHPEWVDQQIEFAAKVIAAKAGYVVPAV